MEQKTRREPALDGIDNLLLDRVAEVLDLCRPVDEVFQAVQSVCIATVENNELLHVFDSWQASDGKGARWLQSYESKKKLQWREHEILPRLQALVRGFLGRQRLHSAVP